MKFPWTRPNLSSRVGGLKKSRYLRGRPRLALPPASWIQPKYPTMDGVAWIQAKTQDQGQTSECGPYGVMRFCSAVRYRNGGVSDDSSYDPHKLYVDTGAAPDEGTTLESCYDTAIRDSWLAPGSTVLDIDSFDGAAFMLPKCTYLWVGIQVTDKWASIGGNGVLASGGKPIGGHFVLAVGCKPDWILVLTNWGQFGLQLNGVYGYIWIHRTEFEAQLMDVHAIYVDLGEGKIGI